MFSSKIVSTTHAYVCVIKCLSCVKSRFFTDASLAVVKWLPRTQDRHIYIIWFRKIYFFPPENQIECSCNICLSEASHNVKEVELLTGVIQVNLL